MRFFGKNLSLLILMLILAAPAAGTDECFIVGNIEAELNGDNPEMGMWAYTLTISWNTGTPYALSHFNMILDVEFGECTCTDFANALNWADPGGTSTGYDSYGEPCSAEYYLHLECGGDPSVPDVDAPLLKFEPDEFADCEPGSMGEGTFVFYSDYPPAPVADYQSFLVDKHSYLACFGTLTGVFPGLPCDPVGAQEFSWGSFKACYR